MMRIDAQGPAAGRHVRGSVPRLFYCTVAGLVIATGVSFLYGASGLFNYRQLQAYERQVSDGIAALQERHRTLQARLQALRENPELTRLLARETGYFRSDETVIEVGPAPPATVGAGRDPDFAGVAPLRQHPPPAPRDPFNALALGLFLGLGLFASLTVLRTLGRRRGADNAPLPGADYAAAARPSGRPRRRSDPGVAARSRMPAEPATPPQSVLAQDSRGRRHAGAPPPQQRERPPGTPAADPHGGTEASGRRRRRARRRRDVTIYRL